MGDELDYRDLAARMMRAWLTEKAPSAIASLSPSLYLTRDLVGAAAGTFGLKAAEVLELMGVKAPDEGKCLVIFDRILGDPERKSLEALLLNPAPGTPAARTPPTARRSRTANPR